MSSGIVIIELFLECPAILKIQFPLLKDLTKSIHVSRI
jgi:hypothetical protein